MKRKVIKPVALRNGRPVFAGDFGGLWDSISAVVSNPTQAISAGIQNLAPQVVEYLPAPLQSQATTVITKEADKLATAVVSSANSAIQSTPIYQQGTQLVAKVEEMVATEGEKTGVALAADKISQNIQSTYFDVRKNITDLGLIQGWLKTRLTSPNTFWAVNGILGVVGLGTIWLGYRIVTGGGGKKVYYVQAPVGGVPAMANHCGKKHKKFTWKHKK